MLSARVVSSSFLLYNEIHHPSPGLCLLHLGSFRAYPCLKDTVLPNNTRRPGTLGQSEFSTIGVDHKRKTTGTKCIFFLAPARSCLRAAHSVTKAFCPVTHFCARNAGRPSYALFTYGRELPCRAVPHPDIAAQHMCDTASSTDNVHVPFFDTLTYALVQAGCPPLSFTRITTGNRDVPLEKVFLGDNTLCFVYTYEYLYVIFQCRSLVERMLPVRLAPAIRRQRSTSPLRAPPQRSPRTAPRRPRYCRPLGLSPRSSTPSGLRPTPSLYPLGLRLNACGAER